MKSKRNITEMETRDSRTLASEFVKLYNKKDISSIKSMFNQMTNNQFGDFIDMLDLKHGGEYSKMAEKLYNDSISSTNITNERKQKMRKEKLIESAVRKIVKKVRLSEGMPAHIKDDLLAGITFEELIITLQSNEPEINEKVVQRVFSELVKDAVENAKEELRYNMQMIIKQANAN